MEMQPCCVPKVKKNLTASFHARSFRFTVVITQGRVNINLCMFERHVKQVVPRDPYNHFSHKANIVFPNENIPLLPK